MHPKLKALYRERWDEFKATCEAHSLDPRLAWMVGTAYCLGLLPDPTPLEELAKADPFALEHLKFGAFVLGKVPVDLNAIVAEMALADPEERPLAD